MLIYIADVKEVEFLYHFIFLVFVTTFLIFVCKPVSLTEIVCLLASMYISVCLPGFLSRWFGFINWIDEYKFATVKSL